jgi:hypothetical protein
LLLQFAGMSKNPPNHTTESNKNDFMDAFFRELKQAAMDRYRAYRKTGKVPQVKRTDTPYDAAARDRLNSFFKLLRSPSKN